MQPGCHKTRHAKLGRDDQPARRSGLFICLYALAWGGGVVAYAPFLTLVLPLRVEAIAPNEKVALLSLITLTGALVASGVNILVGVLSDRTVSSPRGRRPWVALGLVLTLASYIFLSFCTRPAALLAGVILFQFALNIMLGPLAAIAADEAPDDQKGLISAAMGAGGAFGILAGVIVTASPQFNLASQLVIIAVLVMACVLPFLFFCPLRGPLIQAANNSVVTARVRRLDLAKLWIARLLIQVCAGILFTYLVFYIQTVERGGLTFGPRSIDGQAAWLSGFVSIALIPLTIGIGRLSDTEGRRRPFLVISAAMVALGLMVMASAHHWIPAFAAYFLFACGAGLFLALQNAYAMQLLSNAAHRGRGMGILNLTNTLPAIAATGLTWILARGGEFSTLLFVLAGLASVATALMMTVREDPPR